MPSSFKSGVPFFKKERVPSTNDDDDDDDDVKKKKERALPSSSSSSSHGGVVTTTPPPTLPRPGVGSFREDLFATTTTTIERVDM